MIPVYMSSTLFMAASFPDSYSSVWGEPGNEANFVVRV